MLLNQQHRGREGTSARLNEPLLQHVLDLKLNFTLLVVGVPKWMHINRGSLGK